MSMDQPGLLTSIGVGAISVIGAVSKSTQWVDAKTGKISKTLMMSGIATCLIMATIVRAVGSHYGIDDWYQVMFSGVFCYVGPDPIIRMIAGMALKRIGADGDGNNADRKGT